MISLDTVHFNQLSITKKIPLTAAVEANNVTNQIAHRIHNILRQFLEINLDRLFIQIMLSELIVREDLYRLTMPRTNHRWKPQFPTTPASAKTLPVVYADVLLPVGGTVRRGEVVTMTVLQCAGRPSTETNSVFDDATKSSLRAGSKMQSNKYEIPPKLGTSQPILWFCHYESFFLIRSTLHVIFLTHA